MRINRFTTTRFSAARIIATAAAGAAATLGADATALANPAPHVALFGDNFHVVGQQNFCSADLHVDWETDPARPGQVVANLDPIDVSAPQCGFLLNVSTTWSGFSIPVSFSNHSNAPVAITIPTGSGPQIVSLAVAAGTGIGTTSPVGILVP